jgi:PhnB protein
MYASRLVAWQRCRRYDFQDEVAMQASPYLNFDGQCEEAFRFYERSIGARIGDVFRYGGTPMGEEVPRDWHDRIMHATLTVGGQTLMGCDAPPGQYEEPKGISISLHTNNANEAERVFGELASGGKIVMPLEKTFWAERFGMLVDRFGIPWMINCEAAGQAV